MKNCYHCKRQLGFNEEYYVVKESVKPKSCYKRWRDVGVSCEDCYDIGKPTRIETR